MLLSSFEKTNLKSKNVRRFFWLILFLLFAYVFGSIIFIAIRVIGESYPETWNDIVTLINGMSFEFPMNKAGPLFNSSIVFLVISIIFVGAFLLLRWQLLRTGLLATALLSLAHLGCAVLLMVVQSGLAHAVILGLLSVLFVIAFIAYSNILIYVRDRTYLDAGLESLVALYFLFFIVRMLRMALMGGTS